MEQLMETHQFDKNRTPWKLVTLESVVDCFIDYRGKTPTKTEYGIRLVTAKNVKNGVLSLEPQEFISADDYETWMVRGFPKKGDVLFTTEAPLAEVAQIEDENIALAQRIITIRANAKELDNSFLKWSFKSTGVLDEIWKKATGSTVKGIRQKELRKVKIPLPPLPEQHRIVAQLDHAQQLIDQRKAQLRLMDKLVQAVFYEMFGDPAQNDRDWEIRPLSSFVKVDTRMVHDFSDYLEYPHIGIENIERDTGKLIGYRTIEEDGVISGKYLFTAQHIIYSKIRPNLNKVALPTFTGLCSADAYPLLVDQKKSNRFFLTYILRSEQFLTEIMKHSARTNIPKVNKAQLMSFESIIPPLPLQQTFAARVQHIEALKQQMQSSLQELEQNFQALMQQAFGG